MFDLATRPQSTRSPSAAIGVPFDLRLAPPAPAVSMPYTDYVTPTAVPAAGADVLKVYAVELEDTLQTAVILSLFTDARARPDDRLPAGQSDRRGWCGEEFVAADVGSWGSRMWLLHVGKVVGDVLDQARYYASEALQWLVRGGIASRVDVTAQWAGPRSDRLAVRPQIYKPDQVQPVYDVLWGTSITRGAAAS